MKTIIIALIILLCGLQYKLWLASGNVAALLAQKQIIEAQKIKNQKLAERNQALAAEVKELKQGKGALEEHARNELGMVKQGEDYYQVIEQDGKN